MTKRSDDTAQELHDRVQQRPAELAASEAHYRTLVENAPLGIVSCNEEGVITTINQAFLDILGLSRTEETTEINLLTFPPLVESGISASLHRCLETGEMLVTEHGYTGQEDRPTCLRLHISAIHNAEGQVAGAQALVEDISAFKQTEGALRESKQTLQTILNSITDYVWSADIVDSKVVYRYYSPVVERITGCPPDYMMSGVEAWLNLIHPEDRAEAENRLAQELSGKVVTHEYRIIRSDGQVRWLYGTTSPTLAETGKVIRLDGVVSDITKRKQAEETLARERNLLRTVIDNLPDFIYVKDTESRFIIGNFTVGQTMGATTPDELVGKTDFDFYPKDLATQYYADERAIIASGQPLINREEPNIDPAGNKRWILTTKVPSRDSQGQIVGLVGIGRDITERKRVAQQAQKSLERRNRQVWLSAQVAQDIAAATDLTDLYRRVVTLVKEQFGFYHAQLFRYEPTGDVLRLVAGYGKIGAQMVNAGYQIPPEAGIVGTTTITGLPVLNPDLSNDTAWRPDPLLPDAKGELAVPIKLGPEDVQVQIGALKYFIDNGFDGFVVCTIDPGAIIPTAKEALAKGMHVISQSGDLGEENQTARVGIEEYEAGYMLGTQAGEWAKTHLPAGQLLRLGVFNHRAIPEVIRREEGIIAGIKAAFGNNIEIVGNETAPNPGRALPIAERWLQEYPNLNMMVGINDGCALGAYRAVIAAGRDDPDTFFVGGVDAVDEALAAIREGGAYQTTVNHAPAETGVMAVRTLVAAIAGQPYQKMITIKCTPVNLANLDEFIRTRHQVTEEDDLVKMDLSGIKIGLSVMNLANPFFMALADGAREEAKRLGIELVVSDPRQILGVLAVQSDVAGSLDAEDQLALEGLAGQLAAAIETDRLRQEMKERLAERVQLLEQTQMRAKEVAERTRELEEKNRLLEQEISQRKRVEAALQKAHDELEQRVAERTAELAQANTILKEQIAERQRAEEMRAKLEEQLRQSQKMEAIGTLAGGIAHDFNNMLTAIMGYTGLALEALPPDNPVHSDLQGIQKIAQRAAGLTHQLLAFARRQIIEPKVLNLNDLISRTDKMLRRLIGEDIELVTLLAPDLHQIKVDPGQFEQVLVNLAINARDAMPTGGKLIIETTHVTLDEDYAREHAKVIPGEYVLLAVTDDGIGMSEEVKAHLFEPFFTTKEVGKGTGLGLATCFGIVEQNNGHIWIYSEPEQGTTFKIYLPRAEEAADPIAQKSQIDRLPRGTETILLVEDEGAVRDLAVRVLRQQGYTVLEASNGHEALQLVEKQAKAEIHLLVTDVVMPQMGGKALADRLQAMDPHIKVLFISGYTDNTISHNRILEPGAAFLQKPFSLNVLVYKVRLVLDG